MLGGYEEVLEVTQDVPVLAALEIRFFFSSRRRHTRCLSDWSSDVCSSDLISPPAQPHECAFSLRQALREKYPRGNISLASAGAQTPAAGCRFWSRFPRQAQRSEERRVGKECRSRWSPSHHRRKATASSDCA